MSDLPFSVTLLLMVTDRGDDNEHLLGAYTEPGHARAEAEEFNQRNGITPWAPLWHYTKEVVLHGPDPLPVNGGMAERMLAGDAPWRVSMTRDPRAVFLLTRAPVTTLTADSGMRLVAAVEAAFQEEHGG